MQTSISTNGNDVTLTPDATSGGTLIATIHLPCGFTATKTFNINRVTPAPTFTTTNVRTCSTSADMSINPICGASNYTYTIIGNAGVTFTANGQQTLTTTGTTVNVSITGGSSANTIKVKVNYPNNISSAQVSTTLTAGAPTQQTRSSNTFTTNGYAAALQDCNVVTGLESTGYFNGYIDRTDEVATSFTWSLQSKSSNAAVTISPNPDYQHAVISIKPQGASAHYKLTVSNSCGYYITYHSFMANTPCPIVVESLPAASSDFSIAPNPAQDYVSISSTTQSKTANSRNLIYGVKIADQRGILQKTYEFKSGVPSTKVSINGLNPGLYLISIFNGQAWKSKQLIVK